MAELRCDYNPFQASIAAFPAAIRHRRSDQVAQNVQSGFDQNIRGRQRKVSLQVSHSRLFEVLALKAPTKYELVVNLKTARMLGLDTQPGNINEMRCAIEADKAVDTY
ncbi:hypothetical protein [Bradyrhizobium australiense]|uniref:Uncharacterized protein n=1 Tax=Bradyrhizobium australiense TaxID=2721161 RepID=A0A7Y4LTF4_9BRAD|nr:hypothetical protein [Bradyrhizobium australiense]NOJ38177.1 hypothetical protein [Bradyrhizobium australiense]